MILAVTKDPEIKDKGKVKRRKAEKISQKRKRGENEVTAPNSLNSESTPMTQRSALLYMALFY